MMPASFHSLSGCLLIAGNVENKERYKEKLQITHGHIGVFLFNFLFKSILFLYILFYIYVDTCIPLNIITYIFPYGIKFQHIIMILNDLIICHEMNVSYPSPTT